MSSAPQPPETDGDEPVRIPVDPQRPDPDVMERAGRLICSGGLVAFPTETVYGLGANALDTVATDKIFRAKGRPSTDPLIVHVANAHQARTLARTWDWRAERLADAFWPGPLTIVVPKADRVPDSITANMDTVAIRVPAHPVAHALLAAAAVPVAAPSANRFGRVSPTSAEDVESELRGRYSLLIDGGRTDIGVESTVLSLADPPTAASTAILLRPGGVTIEQIESVIGPVQVPERQAQDEHTDAPAPGQFLRHYSPTTPVVAVASGAGEPIELVEELNRRGCRARLVGLPEAPDRAAWALYAQLRACDGTADVLIVGMVRSDGLGRAVNDRIYRAAQGNVVTSCGPMAAERILDLLQRS